LRIRMLGFPKIKARRRTLFKVIPEISSSQLSKAKIGKRAFISGISTSCKGRDAMSEISTATMSSDISSSLNCRLPKSRIDDKRHINTIIVLINVTARLFASVFVIRVYFPRKTDEDR